MNLNQTQANLINMQIFGLAKKPAFDPFISLSFTQSANSKIEVLEK